MAKQSFIQGGYEGKLGATVGFKVDDKFYVRVHTVGHNPRTPEQQAGRAQFARATKLAQMGYCLNKGSPIWIKKWNKQFSQRVGQARLQLDKGVDFWEAIPLYPLNKTPLLLLDDITLTADGGNNYVFSSPKLANENLTRKIAIATVLFDTETNEEIAIINQTEIKPNTTELLKIKRGERYEIKDFVRIYGATTDDEQNGENFIALPHQRLAKP